MAHVTYKIVRHDGGWTYTTDGVFAETFPTHKAAIKAAKAIAAEQRTPGDTEAILWEGPDGKWHEELADGDERPAVDVEG